MVQREMIFFNCFFEIKLSDLSGNLDDYRIKVRSQLYETLSADVREEAEKLTGILGALSKFYD